MAGSASTPSIRVISSSRTGRGTTRWATSATGSGPSTRDDPELKTVHSLLDRVGAHGFQLPDPGCLCLRHLVVPGEDGRRRPRPVAALPVEGSNAEPDHTRFNLPYWQHFDRVIDALYRHGFEAHLLIKVYNKMVHWPRARQSRGRPVLPLDPRSLRGLSQPHLGLLQGGKQREERRLQARPPAVPPRERPVPALAHGPRRQGLLRPRGLQRRARFPHRPAAFAMAQDPPGAPTAARLADPERRVRLRARPRRIE